MANYITADSSVAIVAEVTPGTPPATPAFLTLPYVPGTNATYESDTVQSNVRTTNRGEADIRLTNFRVGGGNKVHFKRDPSIDLLLQSAFSGTWASNVLTAGKTETYLTVEDKWTDGTTPLYTRSSGILVSDFSFDADMAGNIEATFNYMGLTRTQGTTIVTGATYGAVATTTPLTGMDIGTLTIAGLSGISATKFSLKVTPTRETLGSLGSATPFGIGTTDRKVTGSVTLYRRDFTPETTLFTNNVPNKVALVVSIGTLTNGYTFTIPAAQFALPENSEDNSKQLVTLNFTGTVDSVSGTDIKVSKP